MNKKNPETESLDALEQKVSDILEGKEVPKPPKPYTKKDFRKYLIFYGVLGIFVVMSIYMDEEPAAVMPGSPSPKSETRLPLGLRYPQTPPRTLPDDSLEAKYDGNYMDFDHDNNPEDDDEWWEYFND